MTVQARVTEVKSTRKQEEKIDTRGRQSAARGDNSKTKWRLDEEPDRNKPARERTQAPLKEAARVRASHCLKEHSSAPW